MNDDVKMVDSAGDNRTVNNVMRHQYRVLNDQEKADMLAVKDMALGFHNLLHKIGETDATLNRFATRELSLSATAIEEACMWAVKHLTK